MNKRFFVGSLILGLMVSGAAFAGDRLSGSAGLASGYILPMEVIDTRAALQGEVAFQATYNCQIYAWGNFTLASGSGTNEIDPGMRCEFDWTHGTNFGPVQFDVGRYDIEPLLEGSDIHFATIGSWYGRFGFHYTHYSASGALTESGSRNNGYEVGIEYDLDLGVDHVETWVAGYFGKDPYGTGSFQTIETGVELDLNGGWTMNMQMLHQINGASYEGQTYALGSFIYSF